MARLEIPSIVVHNGTNSAPGSPTMERNMRAQRTLSKQATFEELDEVLDVPATKTGDGGKNVVVAVTEKAKNGDHNDKKEGRSNGVVASQDDGRKNGQPLSKMKLLQRSHAMREETSPPPDPDSHRSQPAPSVPPAVAQPSPQKPPAAGNNGNNNNLSVRPPSRHKLSRQGSSRESTDSTASPCLSRENSSEQYTDFTGTDLEHFIMETINKNYKDRQLMLQIEQQLVSYVRQQPPLRQYYKFPAMSSYQRMLVHRVAAYFGMEHNVDQPGQCVVVSRTKGTRIPEVEFKEYIKEDLLFPEEPRRSILKRDSSSFEDGSFKSPERHYGSGECRRSKSFEEREEEYEKARKRIFTKGCDESGGNEASYTSRRSSPDDVHWPGDIQPWSSSESDGRHRNNNNNYLRADNRSTSRLLKVESFEGGDTLKAGSLRMSVSKSYSFGGYSGSGSTRGDNNGGSTRVLTKQDSGSSMSSRISPSSSGYKSQSQRSDATMSATPSPTATPHSHHPASANGDNTVMWAVTDMAAVPPGSLLINPQTGQPFTNADGTVYRYDPNNPLKCRTEESKSVSTQITPEASQPPSPVKNRGGPQHAAIACPSKSTTTTSTSPSFPMTPPPPAVVPQPPAAVVTHVPTVDPSPATYAGLYKTFSQADPSPAANQMNPSQQAYAPAIYPLQQPQADPTQMYTNPPLQCHNPVQPGPVVYTGYNMNHSYDRPPGAADLSMSDLGGYFMGMSLMSDQQRGAGDAGNGQSQQHAYQTQPAQPGPYWPAQQAAAGMPMYYTVPHPGAGPLLASSPPQPAPAVNQPSPRYMTYTSAYQAQPDARQQAGHNGNYMAASGYQVPGYGAPMAAGPPLMAPNGDCMMYAPPPPQSYYQPAPPQYAPAQQQQQPSAASYRAPTPPQTPTHAQPMCGPSFVYLNGGPAYAPVQYSSGPTASGAGPSPPGPAQYLPVLPNVGLFRPNMQIMQSSPPPRPPRDGGSGSKPPYSRSPSVGSNKEPQRHYENSGAGADKVARYPTTVPMFRMMAGRWRTPGDARSLVGSPLQGGLRMQFSLPPHHPNHRGPAQHFAPDNRAPRKPRPKGIMNLSLNNQLRGPHQPAPHHLGGFGGNHDTGRSPALSHGSSLPSKHH